MERAETEPDKNNGSSKSLGRCDDTNSAKRKKKIKKKWARVVRNQRYRTRRKSSRNGESRC
jgi:hypothetical protein